MSQELFLKEIRRKTGNLSLNDEIANVLNISYDAAHRRTSMKSKFSMEESICLAKHYQISLDAFVGTENQIIAKKTKPIRNAADLFSYFENASQILKSFELKPNTEVYYSAKDIPFFYTISDSVLSKFKLFVWMNLLNEKDFLTNFEQFNLGSISNKRAKLKTLYENLNVTEIWNASTISSILNQITYYTEIGLLQGKTAQLILEELKDLISRIEKKAEDPENYFQIFSHELLILNNSLLFKNEEKSTLLVPYNMFGYMMTDDRETCEDALNFFQHQIRNSTSLSHSGQKDRKIFFNKMRKSIESLEEKLK